MSKKTTPYLNSLSTKQLNKPKLAKLDLLFGFWRRKENENKLIKLPKTSGRIPTDLIKLIHNYSRYVCNFNSCYPNKSWISKIRDPHSEIYKVTLPLGRSCVLGSFSKEVISGYNVKIKMLSEIQGCDRLIWGFTTYSKNDAYYISSNCVLGYQTVLLNNKKTYYKIQRDWGLVINDIIQMSRQNNYFYWYKNNNEILQVNMDRPNDIFYFFMEMSIGYGPMKLQVL